MFNSYIVGLVLLVANVACTCWNIATNHYYLLPVNAVGIYFSLDIMKNSD